MHDTTSDRSHAALYCSLCNTFLSTIIPYTEIISPAIDKIITMIQLNDPFVIINSFLLNAQPVNKYIYSNSKLQEHSKEWHNRYSKFMKNSL